MSNILNKFFELKSTQKNPINCQYSFEDRFIPFRKEGLNQVDYQIKKSVLQIQNNSQEEISQNEYFQTIESVLRMNKNNKQNQKVLKFGKNKQQKKDIKNTNINKKQFRSKADEIVQIPGFENDFYKTSFAKKGENIALILNNGLFLLDNHNKEINEIYQAFQCEQLTSVEFDKDGQFIATGNILGEIKIFDIKKQKEINSINAHKDRIGSLSWQSCLLSGSKDTFICNSDLRVKKSVVNEYKGHNAEVCKVLWSFNQQFFISGGNDSKSFAWSINSQRPVMRNSHCSAVRALAWSPQKNGVFYTGGASNDCMLKCWNLNDKQLQFQRFTNSPILDIQSDKNSTNIYTSHGYPDFQIKIWQNNSLKQIAKLKGNNERVLNINVDENEIASVSGDETLRIWKICKNTTIQKKQTEFNEIRILR